MLRTLASASRRTATLTGRRTLTPTSTFRSFSTTKTEEEPLGPSLVEKFNLDCPTRFVPLTVLGFGAASATGLYHFDAETQLLTLWVLFCGTVYSQGGPVIAGMFDDIASDISKEHAKIEQAEIDAVKEALDAHKRQANVFNDIEGIFKAQNELLAGLVGSSKKELLRGVTQGVRERLDILVNEESKMVQEVSKSIVSRATESVEQAYKTEGSELKNNALEAAIAALSNPEGAKQDKNVSNLYNKFFTDYEKRRQALVGTEVELTADQHASLKEDSDAMARRVGAEPVEVPKKFTAF